VHHGSRASGGDCGCVNFRCFEETLDTKSETWKERNLTIAFTEGLPFLISGALVPSHGGRHLKISPVGHRTFPTRGCAEVWQQVSNRPRVSRPPGCCEGDSRSEVNGPPSTVQCNGTHYRGPRDHFFFYTNRIRYDCDTFCHLCCSPKCFFVTLYGQEML
jgi:hypothetical protein